VADLFARLNGFRVLIVEDELIIAMELESLLRRLGYVVLEPAPTIQRALRAVTDQQPDVAVLDMNLQGERATPVAEALQEQGVPFVLVTGYGSERLPERALRNAPCLHKPVDGHQLASAISEVLTRQQRA
jgi:CheY-like chemotaxis protein